MSDYRRAVVITATPFFLKRLQGSGSEHTFSSYLSTTFTATNFIFLGHATVTSKHVSSNLILTIYLQLTLPLQNSPSRRTRLSIYWLVLLNALLVASTFIALPPNLFLTFVLVNSAAQAVAGSYLQTALIAIASLFGPAAVQAMMAGQAAVAVAVSGVQVVSAAASTWGRSSSFVSDGSAEEHSAFIFFTLSTLFLLVSAGIHSWFMGFPSYKAIAAPLEQQAASKADSITSQPLMSRGRSEANDDRRQAIRVAKANITYEVAVGYVFVVTLVSTLLFLLGNEQGTDPQLLHRPSSPRSPLPFSP